MKIDPLRLAGLKQLRLQRFNDERGFFLESYRQPLYEALGIPTQFVQDNLVFSRKGVVRGLHLSLGQAKLISVVQGAIWDVAVDCRPNSPTFGQWEALELNGEELTQFFIPDGFAHGYCALSDTTYVQYKVSTPYDPALERSIRWNDPDLQIPWPSTTPIVSQRDQTSPLFREVFATCTSG
jgi:dTDP-4-dehydrorhamnose 3,5-epimerase